MALRAFVDAFYRIAQDRANKIVILTGAGVWSQVHDEGVQMVENIVGWLRAVTRRRLRC